MNIPKKDASHCRILFSVVLLPNVNIIAYKNALKQAWRDGKMSADESAMLDTLRKSLNISADDHIEIERDVRNELNNSSEFGNNTNSTPAPAPAQENNPGVPNPGPQNNNQNNSNPQPPAGQNGPMTTADLGITNEVIQDISEQPTETNDIKELLTMGKNSYHKGNYEEAIGYCDKVLILDPDNSEALFFRKRTLSKIEKLSGNSNGDVSVESPPTEGAVTTNTNDKDVEKAPAKQKATAGTGGDPNCKSCAGSGECHWCKGTGECYWCKGNGNCDKCNGEGQINGVECKSCKGGGKCHSCNGDGKCYWCHGSGSCSKCST